MASITEDFIAEAEHVLSGTTLREAERKALGAEVDRLKRGKKTLTERITVDEWLEQMRIHAP